MRGKGIQLGGRVYRRGLCLLPRTTMTFALEPGQFDVFESVIGIDDRSRSQAHAVFRVLVDEKLVYEAEAVTLADPPMELRIPLAGVKKLTLQTDFGKNFDLGDHCVFAGARLVKN